MSLGESGQLELQVLDPADGRFEAFATFRLLSELVRSFVLVLSELVQ